MTKNQKSLLAGSLAALTVVAGFWCGGFDFDRRGECAVFCYICALTACGFFAACIRDF